MKVLKHLVIFFTVNFPLAERSLAPFCANDFYIFLVTLQTHCQTSTELQACAIQKLSGIMVVDFQRALWA